MKKFLLGLMVLGSCGLTYGAVTDEYSEKEVIKVEAEVVSPIKLSTNNVNFGRVVQGAKGVKPVQNGEIRINSNFYNPRIVMELYETVSDGDYAKLMNSVRLNKNGADDVRGEALIYEPTFTTDNGKELKLQDGSIVLTGKSTHVIKVGGSIDVPENASTGVYAKNITVKVKYDDVIFE